jgi:gamma-glutamyltranspeptidase
MARYENDQLCFNLDSGQYGDTATRRGRRTRDLVATVVNLRDITKSYSIVFKRLGLGDTITRRRLADTLEAIAQRGADAFYSGPIAAILPLEGAVVLVIL